MLLSDLRYDATDSWLGRPHVCAVVTLRLLGPRRLMSNRLQLVSLPMDLPSPNSTLPRR
jgi:hypothetical protein